MSKEVKRYDPFGCDGLSALMHEDVLGDYVSWDDYDALRTELAEANADFMRIANERESLLDERDALAEKARKFSFVEKAMEALACDEREGGIVTAASLILISSAHRMNAKRGVIDQEGVTFDDGQIGDWRVTIERIDAALQGEQP